MDLLNNLKLANPTAYTTASNATKVLVLDASTNVIKTRSTADVVTDGGGGSGSTARTFQTTIIPALGGASVDTIDCDDANNGYGWPDVGDNLADSKKKAYKFAVPFNPTNYRFTALCVSDADDLGATAGEFGIKFQWSTDDTTWSTDGTDHDIATLNFRGKALGDFASVSGSLSISGSPTLVYIRCIRVNTLTNDSDASIRARAFIANFWN